MTSVDQVEEGPWMDEDGFWLIEPNRLLTRTESALLMGRAPELLAALKTVRDYVADAIATADDPNISVGLSMRQMMAEDLARIDAAISRATGAA